MGGLEGAILASSADWLRERVVMPSRGSVDVLLEPCAERRNDDLRCMPAVKTFLEGEMERLPMIRSTFSVSRSPTMSSPVRDAVETGEGTTGGCAGGRATEGATKGETGGGRVRTAPRWPATGAKAPRRQEAAGAAPDLYGGSGATARGRVLHGRALVAVDGIGVGSPQGGRRNRGDQPIKRAQIRCHRRARSPPPPRGPSHHGAR